MGKSVSFISPPKESHQFKLNYQNMRYSSDWKLFPNHFFHRKSIVVLSAAKLIGAKRNIGRREYFKISPPGSVLFRQKPITMQTNTNLCNLDKSNFEERV